MRAEFGPNSANPRMRRAYAHTQLDNFRKGEVSFDSARAAIDAASHTSKGQKSGFEEALAKFVNREVLEGAIVFIDWTGGTNDTPRFGGYVMPSEDGPLWEQKHRAALKGEYEPYNSIHGAGYPMIWLATTPDQIGNYNWGTSYPLADNPANAHIEKIKIVDKTA